MQDLFYKISKYYLLSKFSIDYDYDDDDYDYNQQKKDFHADLKKTLEVITKSQISDEDLNNWLKINENTLNSYNINHDTIFDRNEFNEPDFKDFSVITLLTNNNSVLLSNNYYIKNLYSNIKEITYTKSSGVIPILYLFSISGRYPKMNYHSETYRDIKINDKNSEYTKYYYIINFLNGPNYYLTQEQIFQFIDDNIQKINNIQNMFETFPKYLGAGSDGMVYSIGNNFILKLFAVTEAYNEAVNAYNRIHDKNISSRTEANIYDVGILGIANKKPVYYYIMEKMKPLDISEYLYSKKLSAIQQYIISKYSENNVFNTIQNNLDNYNLNSKQLQSYIRRFANSISFNIKYNFKNTIEEVKNTCNLKDNWLILFIEEICYKMLTGREDLAIRNLGVTGNGELRYFDPKFIDD